MKYFYSVLMFLFGAMLPIVSQFFYITYFSFPYLFIEKHYFIYGGVLLILFAIPAMLLKSKKYLLWPYIIGCLLSVIFIINLLFFGPPPSVGV